MSPENLTRAERLAERLGKRDEEASGEKEAPSENEAGETVEPPARPEAAGKPTRKAAVADPREKFQAYVNAGLKAEVAAAVFWTNNQPGGYASLTELTEAALKRELDYLRERFNHGQPFQPMPEGKRLPTRPPRGH